MFDAFTVMELEPLRIYDYNYCNSFSHLYAKPGQWFYILYPVVTSTFPREQFWYFSPLEKSLPTNIIGVFQGLPAGFVQLHTL